MLTRKRWTAPNYTGNPATDYANLTKSISDYLLSLEAKGSLTIGEAEINANQGIKFPATQVSSTDANTLDDYEEGTWTPSVGGTATYTSRSGTYTKIGRMVVAHGRMIVNAIGTGSTYEIDGLPFTNGSATMSGYVGYFASAATNVVDIVCYVNNGTTKVTFAILTAAAASVTGTPTLFGNSTDILFTVVYFV